MVDVVEPNDLTRDWQGVLSIERDEKPKALAARRHFRIHVGRLLSAVWKTCVTVAKAPAAAATLDPMSLMEVGASGFGAIVAAVSAVQEPMSAAAFMVCTVLSDRPDGLTAAAIEEDLRFRCTEVPPALFPRYFGITADFLAEARRGFTPPNTVGDVLTRMTNDGILSEKDDRVVFIDRDIVWQLL